MLKYCWAQDKFALNVVRALEVAFSEHNFFSGAHLFLCRLLFHLQCSGVHWSVSMQCLILAPSLFVSGFPLPFYNFCLWDLPEFCQLPYLV